jgi:hypothetical protein
MTKTDNPRLTPNQLVAWNLRRARGIRGWTQEEAAERLEPYLGKRWLKAVYSATERSYAGERVRKFTADDLHAFARAFELPITFFLLQMSGHHEIGHAAGAETSTAEEFLDLVFSLNEPARRALLSEVATTGEGSKALRRWADDHAALVEEREREIAALLAAADELRNREDD